MSQDLDPLHEQNLALLDQIADLEDELEKKKREVEYLGTKVTNLEIDVRRRDETIARNRTDESMFAEINAWKMAASEAGKTIEELRRQQQDTNIVQCPLPHVERRKLPDQRRSDTFKIRIGTGDPTFCPECSQRIWKTGDRTEAYAHCGKYADGTFGDIFIALESLRNGELASVGFAMLGQIISVAVQYGVPLGKIVEKLQHQHDECAGWMMVEENGEIVSHPEIGYVNGFTDAVAKIIERAAGRKDE